MCDTTASTVTWPEVDDDNVSTWVCMVAVDYGKPMSWYGEYISRHGANRRAKLLMRKFKSNLHYPWNMRNHHQSFIPRYIGGYRWISRWRDTL